MADQPEEESTVELTVTQARYYLHIEDLWERLHNVLKQDLFARFDSLYDTREEDENGARACLIEQLDAIEKAAKK